MPSVVMLSRSLAKAAAPVSLFGFTENLQHISSLKAPQAPPDPDPDIPQDLRAPVEPGVFLCYLPRMLQASELSKAYGTQLLFENANFTINPGEKIGLVGRNGHGKSTLFRIILGEEQADQGNISISNGYRIGHLSQHLVFHEATVLREAASALPANEDGWEETYKAEAILSGLGFSEEEMQQSPTKLSGGYQIRLNLAKLLVSEPHLLLLDEPTNYLDIVSLRWLVRFLRSWEHELMLITHERGFMDSITTHTMAIHRYKIRKMKGPTAKLYEQIATEEEIHEKTRANQEEHIKKTEDFIRRFRAKATKASAVQSRVKALEKIDKLEKLENIESLDFRFRYADFIGKWVLRADHLRFGYDAKHALIEDLSFSVKPGERIAVIGKNGKGKTTLLRLLCSELQLQKGDLHISPHTRLSYFGQTNVERLDAQKTVEDEILSVHPEHNRTAARTICGQMMFSGDLALKKVAMLSGGEKSRVLLGKILVSPSNLLLLDEPSNHLDMYASEAFMQAIEDFPGSVIMVTHSEEMIERLATKLIVFDGEKSFVFNAGYKDFLEKIGWKDEEGLTQGGRQTQDNSARASKLDKKEQRRIKAEISKERSDQSKPLQKSIAALESEIIKLEEQVKRDTEELIEISKDGFGESAAKLSRALSENKEQIERLFSELELQSEKLSQIESHFDELLNKRLAGA